MDSAQAALVTVDGFTKAYDREVAVEDLSFNLVPGEVCGLVGPNGAGKTTTLRAIAGVIAPTRGRLVIEGFDVQKDPVEAKRRLALVPHDPHLFGSLTIWEHIEFTARIYGVEGYTEKAEELLARFRLSDKRGAMGDELSRGMQQKVALSCALLHSPKVLLLDEPLTGLDPHAIRTVFDMVKEQAAAGAAVLISSHLLDQVDRTCSTFMILSRGRLLFRGSKAEIRERLGDLRADATLEDLFFSATAAEDAPAS